MINFRMLTLFMLMTLSAGPAVAQTANTQAQQLIEEAVRRGACAGIAAGFSVDGTPGWTSGAGFSNLKEGIPFQANTPTRIASITKPMTAVAILQLHEQGKLDLDAPVTTYISDFPKHSQGTITVRHLLQHSSGIEGYRSGKERENTKAYADLEAAAAIFQDRELLFAPGSDFHYTTYGYILLGLIIERVSGMDYESYLKKHIWDPAGMTRTGVERSGSPAPGQAALYHNKGKGKIKSAKPTDLSDRIPGGGVYSTVTDLLHFGRAILDHRLLKSETLQLMWSDPGLKQEGNSYGLGWYLYGKNPKYGEVYGHNGAQTGASTFLMLLPEQNTVITVLSNTSGAMQEVTNITIQLFDLAAQAGK